MGMDDRFEKVINAVRMFPPFIPKNKTKWPDVEMIRKRNGKRGVRETYTIIDSYGRLSFNSMGSPDLGNMKNLAFQLSFPPMPTMIRTGSGQR